MQIENHLRHLLQAMETQGEAGRADLINMAAIETNGMFKHPQPDNNWDTQMYEIKAHGVCASGVSEPEAIRNWCLVAERVADASDALHHAETILNDPSPVPTETMRAACHLVLQDGRKRENCAKARGILSALDAAA